LSLEEHHPGVLNSVHSDVIGTTDWIFTSELVSDTQVPRETDPDQFRQPSVNWTMPLPVYNLELSKEIGGEFHVENVTFVRQEKIHRIRRRLGFDYRISAYNKAYGLKAENRLFRKAPVYAFVKHNKRLADPFHYEYLRTQEALFLLASSQFDRFKRTRKIRFGLPDYDTLLDEVVMFEKGADHPNLKIIQAQTSEPYCLDKLWKGQFAFHFFFDLMKLLKNKKISPKWKYCIRSSAILAGRSLFARDLWEAFLFDMVAIETLLARKGPHMKEQVIHNLTTLFGWLSSEREDHWLNLIEKLYARRADYVKQCHSRQLTAKDLINADMILSNLLKNLCVLTRIHTKDDLFHLCDEIKARRALNMKMLEKPFISFCRNRYTGLDLKKLEDRKNWL
jgi:hypothetical protein